MKRYPFVIAAIVIFLAAIFIADHQLWLVDDRGHHDVLLLDEQLADARASNRSDINVIAVAGGNWFALCLVGPGESPQSVLTEFGRKTRLRVPKVQRVRSWLYVGNVPRGEAALVVLTDRFSIRSRRLPNYTGNPSFKSSCAVRTDPGLRWK